MRLTKTYLLFAAALFWAVVSVGQNKTVLTAANADCSGIIDLLAKDTVFGPTTAPIGPGQTKEITGEKNSLTSFEKEHNSVWYRFRVPNDGLLTFEIIPLNPKDDYDFVLYKYAGKTFCADVANKKVNPVRTCISRNEPALGSRTGLKQGAEDEFIHSGPGASWCKPLTVKKGEIFVLVLDNVYPGGKGHTLKIRMIKAAPVVTPPIVEQVVPPQQNPVQKALLKFKVVDKSTKQPVKADVEIVTKKNPGGNPIFKADSISQSETSLGLNNTYFIRAEACNYFGCVTEVKTLTAGGDLNITLELDRIEAGKNVVFENILFYGDQSRFLSESTPSLQALANTMIRNPKLVIEVEGHVNWPKMMENQNASMQEHNMELSEERAKAVVDYLITRGIAAKRMTYKGYGSTRMLYPAARSEEQMKQNRRVEIVIISNE